MKVEYTGYRVIKDCAVLVTYKAIGKHQCAILDFAFKHKFKWHSFNMEDKAVRKAVIKLVEKGALISNIYGQYKANI